MQVKHRKSIGLDIGQANAKVVCLARKGRDIELTRAEVFRSQDEGILGDDEAEQMTAVAGWLKDLKLHSQRVVLGLPQYMATTQVSDFAPGVSGYSLSKMVQLETMQLSGISDDRFLHDYAVMPAGNGRKNPVLIGICRAANIDDYAGRAADVGIQLEDVAMNALALANAFIRLKPEAAQSDDVQYLLDVGTETSTLVVMSGGQVLSIGGIMFGGQNITHELAEKLLLSENDAERRKVKGEIDWQDIAWQAVMAEDDARKDTIPTASGDSMAFDSESDADAAEKPLGLKLKMPRGLAGDASEPSGNAPDADAADAGGSQSGSLREQGILACFNTLCRELNACVEHWRASENETLNQRPVSRLWLCGASAELKPLRDCLAVYLGCDVELLGPFISELNPVGIEYTVAYGLALQGMGAAPLPLSLAPDALTWMHRKEARGRYVVAALVVLALFIIGWSLSEYMRLQSGIARMKTELSDVKMSVRSIQKLDQMKRDYCGILMRPLPIVSSVTRTQKFMDVMALLESTVKGAPHKDSVSWCVYVADEDSFNALNEDKESKAAILPQVPQGGGRRSRRLLMDTVEPQGDSEVKDWQQVLKKEATVSETISVKPLKRIYVVGIIMSKNDNHNPIERDLLLRLKEQKMADGKTPAFADVQVMSEEERNKCASRAMLDWEKCFANMRTSEAFKSYDHKAFFWRLELSDPIVMPPAENPLYVVRKTKRKK